LPLLADAPALRSLALVVKCPADCIVTAHASTVLQERPTNAPIKNEATNGLLNERGTLAMARTGAIHSATSQFFINTVDNQFLNHGRRDFGYCVFGKVTSGMDIVDKISEVRTGGRGPFQSDVPLNDVVIEKISVM